MAKKYLINGIWSDIVLVCGNHEKPVDMNIQQGPHSLFYACPKYFEENREEGEHKCANRLNLIEFEKMVDHINEMMCSEAINYNNICLKNHSWKEKGVQYKILVHYDNKIVVQCVNTPALTNIER